MSLYNIIDHSKQATVRPAYRLKNCREKLARYSNHLTFLSRCRSHGFIPNGLKVHLPVKSEAADHIAERTSEALLRERIRTARRQKAITKLNVSRLESNLSQSLSTEQWPKVDELCRASAKRVHLSTKTRQIRKFENLQSQKPQPSPQLLDPQKLVVNLSQKLLSPEEKNVLALGMSFAIAPKQIPYQEIIAATESLTHRIDERTAHALRLGISSALRDARPPRPNLSFRQRQVIRNLKKDTSIVILPADKGRATVVMNKEDCVNKMQRVLRDGKYTALCRDPTVRT